MKKLSSTGSDLLGIQQDEELQEAARWGLWEEDENDEPVRRIGCIHELVFSADPENDDEG